MVRRALSTTVANIVAIALTAFGATQARAQPRQNPADAVRDMDAVRNMFEQMGQQASQFVPGMFSELTPQQMAELERVPIAPREEADFGNQVLKNYEASLRAQNQTLTRQGGDVTYLSALVQRIRPLMPKARRYPKIDVGLVETENIDAYSVPGGHLIFTSGLMNNVESEAELVGVIAHELSHLDRGHQLLMLKQLKTTGRISDLRSGMLWVSIMAKPFRPEFESQADADAVKWMAAAGYDPRQLAKLLRRWEASPDQNPEWTRMLPNFARSHPGSGKRAMAVLDDFARLKMNPTQLVVGEDNLIKRQPATTGRDKP